MHGRAFDYTSILLFGLKNITIFSRMFSHIDCRADHHRPVSPRLRQPGNSSWRKARRRRQGEQRVSQSDIWAKSRRIVGVDGGNPTPPGCTKHQNSWTQFILVSLYGNPSTPSGEVHRFGLIGPFGSRSTKVRSARGLGAACCDPSPALFGEKDVG